MEICLAVYLLDDICSIFLSFEDHPYISVMLVSTYSLTNSIKHPSYSNPSQHISFCLFFSHSQSLKSKQITHCGFGCLSLMISVSDINVSSYTGWPFRCLYMCIQVFCPFSNWDYYLLAIELYEIYPGYLCLLDIHFANIVISFCK